jgi:hypothetical protein
VRLLLFVFEYVEEPKHDQYTAIRMPWNTDLSSPLFLSIILADVFELFLAISLALRTSSRVVVVRTNTSRTRRLSVTSCAHPVAMVASATDSALDRQRAFALLLVHINRGCLHCGDVERNFVFEQEGRGETIRGRLGSVMRYLGKHRCGPPSALTPAEEQRPTS